MTQNKRPDPDSADIMTPEARANMQATLQLMADGKELITNPNWDKGSRNTTLNASALRCALDGVPMDKFLDWVWKKGVVTLDFTKEDIINTVRSAYKKFNPSGRTHEDISADWAYPKIPKIYAGNTGDLTIGTREQAKEAFRNYIKSNNLGYYSHATGPVRIVKSKDQSSRIYLEKLGSETIIEELEKAAFFYIFKSVSGGVLKERTIPPRRFERYIRENHRDVFPAIKCAYPKLDRVFSNRTSIVQQTEAIQMHKFIEVLFDALCANKDNIPGITEDKGSEGHVEIRFISKAAVEVITDREEPIEHPFHYPKITTHGFARGFAKLVDRQFLSDTHGELIVGVSRQRTRDGKEYYIRLIGNNEQRKRI